MAQVYLEKVYKAYESNQDVVHDFNLKIDNGEFLVLVGPSGCGKSTTLRMIAGLEEISRGEIRIGDQVVNNIPPKDRDIAMVFQNYALYPHMSVYDNMAFGLKLRKISKHEITERVMKASSILELNDLLGRKPKALSGGQRQRVAMGRAIVRKPAVFLFDEPLSNLDAKMRVEMRKEILKLHARIATTMIYVTHDQVEAMTLGSRICVMNMGVIEQVGPPSVIFDHPASVFVANFIGTPSMNLFEGKLSRKNDTMMFEAENIQITLPPDKAAMLLDHEGHDVYFGIRPRALRVVQNPDPSHSVLSGKVEVSEMLGEEILIHLINGKHEFISSMHPHEHAAIQNDLIHFIPDLRLAHIFEKNSGKNLTLSPAVADATLPERISQ